MVLGSGCETVGSTSSHDRFSSSTKHPRLHKIRSPRRGQEQRCENMSMASVCAHNTSILPWKIVVWPIESRTHDRPSRWTRVSVQTHRHCRVTHTGLYLWISPPTASRWPTAAAAAEHPTDPKSTSDDFGTLDKKDGSFRQTKKMYIYDHGWYVYSSMYVKVQHPLKMACQMGMRVRHILHKLAQGTGYYYRSLLLCQFCQFLTPLNSKTSSHAGSIGGLVQNRDRKSTNWRICHHGKKVGKSFLTFLVCDLFEDRYIIRPVSLINWDYIVRFHHANDTHYLT